jgi:putative transposase
VSLINYHFVFCPRYRRKIFNIPGVEDRFKVLTAAECDRLGIEVLAMECHVDHAHLFLSCLPSLSPSDIMHQLKGATSFALREEFPQLVKMPSLWTRSFFVSTADNVSSETIKWYVDTQKTRY